MLVSCSAQQLDVSSIQIVKVNQHPILIDHDRKLLTLDESSQTIAEIKLYPDTGSGCDAYLFEVDDNYILIDCNGQWISVNKQSGHLKNEGWKWQELPPTNQVGVFKRSDTEKHYKFSTAENIDVNDVYKYKDPSD
jgi:hypothetical protein